MDSNGLRDRIEEVDQVDIGTVEIMTGLAMYKNQFLLKQDFP